MFSTSRLNRWALSISTAAVTVVGTFSPITISPVAAQTAPCISNADFNAGTFDIRDITRTNTLNSIPNPDKPPANISGASQTAARNAAIAFYPTNNPNTLFTRFDRDGTTFEFRGKQPNGCQLEVDALQPSNRIEEIEQQIRSSAFNTAVPAPVRNRLNQEIPNRTIVFIEKSIRPNRVVGPNDSLNGDPVFYEIEVNCTGPNPPYCAAGQSGEATISANGNNFAFELNQD